MVLEGGVVVMKVTGILIVILLGLYGVALNWAKGLGNPHFKDHIESRFAKEILDTYFFKKVGILLPVILAGLAKSYYSLALIPFTCTAITILTLLVVLSHPLPLPPLGGWGKCCLYCLTWIRYGYSLPLGSMMP